MTFIKKVFLFTMNGHKLIYEEFIIVVMHSDLMRYYNLKMKLFRSLQY